MYFCLWNLESWALESGIQPKLNNPDPTKDWDPESKPVNWEMNPDWVQYLDCAISMWIQNPRAQSIQPKFQPVRLGKVVHLKRWTRFFETFPVGPNRSIEFWTEISGTFGWMDRAPRLPWIPLHGAIISYPDFTLSYAEKWDLPFPWSWENWVRD